jgi:putative transcriptional regulator
MTRLAERIGVDRSYISKLEAGRRQPSARIVFAMARYFGCKVDELFEYVPDEKNAG